MKKRFSFRSVAASLLLPLAACGGPNIGKDSQVTNELEQIAKSYPIVKDLTRSVAWIQPGSNPDPSFLPGRDGGSGVLLDQFGTIAFTNHQTLFMSDKVITVGFIDPATGSKHQFRAIVDIVDEKLDVGLARIDHPAFNIAIQYGQVRPAKWGNVRQAQEEPGHSLLLIGFPATMNKLHAAIGGILSFQDTHPTRDGINEYGTTNCKVTLQGPVYNGMSGGLAADGQGNGEFLGILNRTHIPTAIFKNGWASFTPSYAIYAIYQTQYPDRARNNPYPYNITLTSSCVGKVVPFDPKQRPLSGPGPH